MADQDPPIEPLRRLDPAEPDEQGLGRLERLDPEEEETAKSSVVTAAPPPTTGSRIRDGLSAAITLAVLMSLSSIAAIGGLVAISMQSAAPAGPGALGSVETGMPVTTIRVGESAQGLEEEPADDRGNRRPGSNGEAVVPAPAPAPVPAPAPPAPGNGEGKTDGGGKGKGGGSKGDGAAWCDARVGSACDAVAGGSVLQPSEPEGEGFVPSDDDEYVGDDDADDDDDDVSTGSSGSHHSGKGH